VKQHDRIDEEKKYQRKYILPLFAERKNVIQGTFEFYAQLPEHICGIIKSSYQIA
jgi:hypothetical protein